MLIDYNKQECFTKTLDIVDIGNVTIRAISETDCLDYYIIIKTIMGKTSILRFGPLMPDVTVLLNGFSLDFQKIDFKEKSIMKAINLYINDSRKKITDAVVVEDFEALNTIPNFAECIMEV